MTSVSFVSPVCLSALYRPVGMPTIPYSATRPRLQGIYWTAVKFRQLQRVGIDAADRSQASESSSMDRWPSLCIVTAPMTLWGRWPRVADPMATADHGSAYTSQNIQSFLCRTGQ